MKKLTQDQVLGLVSAFAGMAIMGVVIYSASINPNFTEDIGYHITFGFGMVLTMGGIYITRTDA